MVVDQEKLAKLQAAARTGGKGAPRRKIVKKPKGAVAGGEDTKLQGALKKLAVQPITGIEEVNMFKEDGNVLHIANPKGTSVCIMRSYIQCTALLNRTRWLCTARLRTRN